MIRSRLARGGAGEDFSWRGLDASRVEGLSDAVFAFAVTLLVVSLEVPNTFEELLATMRGFFAFAVCFALLLSVWYEHYKYFGRYGLRDTPTIWLNAVLLFLVLVYVYPLKFLFTLFVNQLLGVGGETIEASQVPLLMVIYGSGFVAVQFVFVLFYLRAHALRGALGLDARETSITREETQGYVVNVLVGLSSIAIAIVGGTAAVSWAGSIYFLIFPLQMINARLMSRRRAKEYP